MILGDARAEVCPPAADKRSCLRRLFELENLLNLSDPSKAVALLLGMLSEADRRERKLASLRSAVATGTYRVSAALVADAILRAALQ